MGGIDGPEGHKALLCWRQGHGDAGRWPWLCRADTGAGTSGLTWAHAEQLLSPGGAAGQTQLGGVLPVSAPRCPGPPSAPQEPGVTYSEATAWGMGSSSSSKLCRIQ